MDLVLVDICHHPLNRAKRYERLMKSNGINTSGGGGGGGESAQPTTTTGQTAKKRKTNPDDATSDVRAKKPCTKAKGEGQSRVHTTESQELPKVDLNPLCAIPRDLSSRGFPQSTRRDQSSSPEYRRFCCPELCTDYVSPKHKFTQPMTWSSRSNVQATSAPRIEHPTPTAAAGNVEGPWESRNMAQRIDWNFHPLLEKSQIR